jgi:hypothetical protein
MGDCAVSSPSVGASPVDVLLVSLLVSSPVRPEFVRVGEGGGLYRPRLRVL